MWLTNLERTPTGFQVGVTIEGTVLSPSSCDMGTDRLSWFQCQAPGSRNWPSWTQEGLPRSRSLSVSCFSGNNWEGRGFLCPARKEGRRSTLLWDSHPGWWGGGLLAPGTWSFLQHLAVETDGRFVVLFSEHQVSQHLSEDTRGGFVGAGREGKQKTPQVASLVRRACESPEDCR